MNLQEITRAAQQLSVDEKELLIHALAEDFPESERARIDTLWREEIQSRHEARQRGEIPSRPFGDAMEDLQRKLNAIHPD